MQKIEIKGMNNATEATIAVTLVESRDDRILLGETSFLSANTSGELGKTIKVISSHRLNGIADESSEVFQESARPVIAGRFEAIMTTEIRRGLLRVANGFHRPAGT